LISMEAAKPEEIPANKNTATIIPENNLNFFIFLPPSLSYRD
jgi:hypothetical protein